MCSVTFIARRRGYCLGMNRDEKLTRPPGLPPTTKERNGRKVLCPSEPNGGTWIAVNDSGACLALINWYSVPQRVQRKSISRGEVVSKSCSAASPGVVDASLQRLPLRRINPFRLIGIFPAINEIHQWRWNLRRLIREKHLWKTQQWISSGFDEPTAQYVRSRTFQLALRQHSAGRAEWLRRLHRSHTPQSGPFSTCMHRADAATVSYTEVGVSSRHATMGYHAYSPCNSINRSEKIQPDERRGPTNVSQHSASLALSAVLRNNFRTQRSQR